MLLSAFAIGCRSGLPAGLKLVCSGAPGARRDWLLRSAQSLGLGDRVLFPGFLPEPELAALMSRSRGVVFPSLYEGFGLPVIEAMACGVPVACGRLTALPEIAGDAAMLFDPRVPAQIVEALVSLACDEALRARLIDAGTRRAAEFADAERMAAEYWDLFRSAWATHGGGT